MSTGIFIRHKGESFLIEELNDKELQLYIDNKRRYQDNDKDQWNWVKDLVQYIREQPKRYIISAEDLEKLQDGQTIRLIDGKTLLVEYSVELEEIKKAA